MYKYESDNGLNKSNGLDWLVANSKVAHDTKNKELKDAKAFHVAEGSHWARW